ncbi:hypothetical protein I5Q34_08880 [Streptomyces sp. AV19]|uniref:hypothetical protein n=1 Tax=Streptomyces sp. AV19 TaxID=2793068 RepID=UPI0018FEBC4B|nr:hypothetical protein [Streptomyces sp. AV19]MBH1934400.1 hypothetical protein [Streptomyces sp. AV19]MDG4536254.1 hypothetical protein [Streptomyces sp. AV19]
MPIEKFPIHQGGGTIKPHSITVGPAVDNVRYLWVTSDNNKLVQIDRGDPNAQATFTDMIPPLSAGITSDPTGRKVVWFASPANQQTVDPIYEFDVDQLRVINKHNLQDTARAQTLTTVHFKTGEGESAPTKDYILAAEPMFGNVAYVDVGKNGASYFQSLPLDQPGFKTWFWSIAATLDSTQTIVTYWLTGQKHGGDQPRTDNGLYTLTPATDNTWRRITLPNGTAQVPIHIIAGDVTENGERKTCLWISASGKNQILRYDLKNKSWSQSVELTGEPRQLAFGPDGYIWVAGVDKIYRFKKDSNVASVPSPGLEGGEAHAICVDPYSSHVWYTDRKNLGIGRYPIPSGGKSALGKTQLVVQPITSVATADVAEVPLVASFVADGNPTPGIPLTCRIVSEEATFLDGGREHVIPTDVLGQVAFPSVLAGKAEEDVVLEIGWGNHEPPTTVTLRVRNDLEDDQV